MKIRLNYVSNSSSSSYVIAYDPNFFGNISTLFEDYYIGCESYSKEDLGEFLNFYCNSDEEKNEFKKKVEEKKKDGKQVIYIHLDNEFNIVMTLIKMINKNNGGNKLEILFNGSED